MNKFTYETQGNNTYLVYEIGDSDIIDTMSLGMIINNRIPGIAQTLFTQMDASKLIRFNVSAKVNISQFFSGVVNKKRLMGVFTGIVDAMLAAEDYMLNENSLLLDREYIFTDVSTCETVMICLPVDNAEAESYDIGAFFKDIMFATRFDQTENCDYIAKIINYLNAAPRFSLVDFKAVLDEINLGAASAAPAQAQTPPPAPSPARPVQTPPQAQMPPRMQTPPQAQPPQQTPARPAQQMPPQGQMPSQGQHQYAVPPAQGQRPGMPPIPPANGANVRGNAPAQGQAAPQAAPEGKGMSWLYLMQHYNKENAAAYKAQKEARKRAAAGQMPPQQMPPQQMPPQGQMPTKTAPAQAPQGGFGFAVPGAMPPQPPKAGKHPAAPVPQVPQGVPVQPAINYAQPQPAPAPAPQAAPQMPPQNAFNTPASPAGQMANFGETTVLGGGSIGETTVLGAATPANSAPQPVLIRVKNNERIPLNKPVFRVGKERSYVDYFVGDNPAISRSHANFIIRDGEYFVVDTNSTNHTYVNEVMINSSVETKISSGDKIRLANENFEFKVL